MKRYFYLLFLILLFTSCFDLEEYIYLNNDDFELHLKYTVKKSLLEAAASIGGKPVDYESFRIKEDELLSSLKEVNGKVEKIDNSMEFGTRIKISGKYSIINNMTSSDELFPKYEKNRVTIKLLSFEKIENETKIFLLGEKFRIIIEKTNTIKGIKRVELISDGDKYDSNDILVEYRGFYIIEIPIILLFEGKKLVLNIYM